jgi:hypothetical protein
MLKTYPIAPAFITLKMASLLYIGGKALHLVRTHGRERHVGDVKKPM